MILMFHKVHPDSPTLWWVRVNDFYRQMSELTSKEVVYLDDYDIQNPNHVVITFDGIYKNVLEFAFPILKKFNYPFELFITSNYIGSDNEFDIIEPRANFTDKEELSKLVKGGGRLQWHTKSHINLKKVVDNNIIAEELSIPEDIKSIDPNGFKWFAYPHGEFNDIVVAETKKRFIGALSCNQGNDSDKYVLNRLTVVNETSLKENKISCIIASYNYGDYLVEAVESVLNQTILPDEILISDDSSDDDTQLIAEGYVKQYPKLIKYNRNKTNLGIVDHFNKAISLTNGDYVFFLGADNRLVSNYIEECYKILESDNNIGIAYTDYALFGSRAKIEYERFNENRKGEVRLNTYYQIEFPEFDSHNDLVEEMKVGNFIQGSSMFKRVAFDEVGGYKKSNNAEDYNLFKRIIDKGWEAKKARKTNLEYRQHSASQANNILSVRKKMTFYENIFKERNSFEKSKIYKLSFYTYKGYIFLKRNYNKPKKIIGAFKYVLKK